jgi:hypothetical protein
VHVGTHSARAIGATAARHGGDLLRLGFTVSQVVHDYGDICQTITALAVDQHAPISVEDSIPSIGVLTRQ